MIADHSDVGPWWTAADTFHRDGDPVPATPAEHALHRLNLHQAHDCALIIARALDRLGVDWRQHRDMLEAAGREVQPGSPAEVIEQVVRQARTRLRLPVSDSEISRVVAEETARIDAEHRESGHAAAHVRRGDRT